MKNALSNEPCVLATKMKTLPILFQCGWAVFILIGLLSCSTEENKLTEFHIYAADISWEKKGDCSIKIVDQTHIDSAEAKIKYRGGMSSRYEKRSYAITLWKKKPIDGLPEAKKWVLNASYIDKSFMRHKLSFDLWRQMDQENKSPHCSYVNVYQNEAYEGLYILMQRMDKHSLQINVNDPKAFIFKEPPLLFPKEDTPNRDSMYLATQKFPKLKKGDASAQLKELEALIFEGDNEAFKNNIFKLLDRDNLIDWQLLLMLTNNGDGQLKNYYIYKQGASTPMKIALWDYDHSFGRDGDNEPNMLARNLEEKRTLLFQRLLELNPNNFNEKMSARWIELRKTVFTNENIALMMSENDKIIGSHVTKNAERWSIHGKWYFDDNDYIAELDLIKDYVSRRLKQLDKRFNHQEK